jgi:glutaredoxin
MNPLEPGDAGVYVYALSTCPWCRKTKQWFADQHVAFESVDVDELPPDEEEAATAKAYELSGSRGFPVVLINGHVVSGFNPQEFSDILEGWHTQDEWSP